MSSHEWRSYKLGDICVKIGSGATPRGGKEAYLDDGPIALIRSQNVLDYSFSYEGLAFIDREQAAQLSNVELVENDVLLNITGDSVARVCQVPSELLPARVNQHVSIIRPNQSKLDNQFLKYYLLNPKFKNYMLALASVGATRNALTKGMIENFELNLPSPSTQRRIADILSALDDKIELNRQTNATLEALAQAIFKEWFVNFNYPGSTALTINGATGEMVESELGLIPKGWRVGTIGEIAKIKHGFAFKGQYFSEDETADILLTPGNFRIGGGFNYTKFKYYQGDYPQEYILEPGDLIVTMTDLSKQGDTLGFSARVPAIPDKNLLHNQRIGKVEITRSDSWKLLLYFIMQQSDYRNYVLSGATGTTVKHTSPGRICEYKLALPESNVVQAFETTVQELIDHVEHNYLESAILAQIRNVLLPKLMRGEIEV